MLKIKRLSEAAKLPTKANFGDLGYDLFASKAADIYPNETALVSTEISVQFPFGYGAFIKDRSSIATKRGLFTVAGVIDNGYIGEIFIAMHNSTDDVIRVAAGEKIAQMVLIPTVTFEVEEVNEVFSVDARGVRGFGSSNEVHVPVPYDNYR